MVDFISAIQFRNQKLPFLKTKDESTPKQASRPRRPRRSISHDPNSTPIIIRHSEEDVMDDIFSEDLMPTTHNSEDGTLGNALFLLIHHLKALQNEKLSNF